MRARVIIICTLSLAGAIVLYVALARGRARVPASSGMQPGDLAQEEHGSLSTGRLALTPNARSFHQNQPADSNGLDVSKFYDPALMSSNPAYQARVQKHLDLRYYANSPAKDTQEGREIRELVQRNGGGLDAVPEAYNATYEYWRLTDLAARGNDPNMQIIIDSFRQRSEATLRDKYGISNETFYTQLFQIRPRVFFGQKDLQLKMGEELLE